MRYFQRTQEQHKRCQNTLHKIMMLYNIYSVCSSTSIPDCSFCQLAIDSFMGRRKYGVDLVQTSPTLWQFDLALSALDKKG